MDQKMKRIKRAEMLKRIGKLLLLTMMLFSLSFTAQAAQKKITLSKKNLTMRVGSIVTIKAKKKGLSGNVKWKSSNPAVAKVSKGRITALKKGTCVITAYIGKVKAKAAVTVKKSAAQKYMERFLKYYKAGDYAMALSWNSRLPKAASEDCVLKMPAKVRKAYLETMNGWIAGHPYGTSNDIMNSPYVRGYYLTDFTNNGVADLIIILGPETTNNYRLLFYTYSGGKAKLVADDIEYYTLAAYPGHKGVVMMHGRMGGETIYVVTPKNGKLQHVMDKSRQAYPYTELGLKLDDHYVTWENGPVVDLSPLM